MCDDCEGKVRESVEDALRLLAHDTSSLTPSLRSELENDLEIDPISADSFFINAAIARLACALAYRDGKPPFIVLGEIAGTMMTSQIEAEAMEHFMNVHGMSRN